MNNVIKTKLRHLGIITESAIYGTLYHNVVRPLVSAQVIEVPNRNNILISDNGQQYAIRLDLAVIKTVTHSNEEFMEEFRREVKELIEDLTQKVSLWHNAGSQLFKDITDCNDLNRALMICNTFKKDGVTITSRKVKENKDDDEGVMQYEVTTEFGNHHFVTSDDDEVMVFLGSLARVFTSAHKRPDPKWFSRTVKPAEFPY